MQVAPHAPTAVVADNHPEYPGNMPGCRPCKHSLLLKGLPDQHLVSVCRQYHVNGAHNTTNTASAAKAETSLQQAAELLRTVLHVT
jgi:hypothetical protein